MMWAHGGVAPELPPRHGVNGLQHRIPLGPRQMRRGAGRAGGQAVPDQEGSPVLSGGSPGPAQAVMGPPCRQQGEGPHAGSPVCNGAHQRLRAWQGARSEVDRRERVGGQE